MLNHQSSAHALQLLNQMQAALDLIKEAVVWTDAKGQIQRCNLAFEQFVNRSEPILDQPILEVLHLRQLSPASLNHPLSCCFEPTPQTAEPIEQTIYAELAQGNCWQPVEITVADVIEADSTETAITETISSKLIVIRALAAAPTQAAQPSEENHKLALSANRIGIWEWDLETNAAIWSTEALAALGLGDQVEANYQNWRSCIHLRDVERVERELLHAIATGSSYESEYRVVHPDGSLHWLLARGEMHSRSNHCSTSRSSAAQPPSMIGIVTDISNRKRDEVLLRLAEEAWQENQQILDAIMANLPGGVFRCLYRPDQAINFAYASEAYRDLVGLSPAEMSACPQSVFERFHLEDHAAWQSIVQSAQTSLEPSYLEYRVSLPSGEEKWLARTARFSWAANGDFVVDGIDIDITDRKQAEAALRDILQGTASATGEEFFPVLVQTLASALGVRHAFVFELDEHRQQLHPLACWSDKPIQSTPSFDLTAPSCCQTTLEQGFYCCFSQVQQRFPNVELLNQLQAESYLGVAMLNGAGKPIGNLCIIDDKPLKESERAEAILRIFAARAAAELERQWAIVALQQLNQELETRVSQRTQELITSLSEKEVLLREVHHRVKNNLQMIQSLLNLQARSTEDPRILEVLAESQQRIKAMSLVHEKLYQSSNLAQINFAEYVRSLTRDLFQSYLSSSSTVQLAIQIADLELPVDTAISCGLIINELFSNAAKYAFPSEWLNQQTGVITVQFLLDPEASPQPSARQYVLIVADNGVGIAETVEIQTAKSLGLRLVYALTRQLRGTLELDRHNGTKFRITFAQPSP